MNKLRAIGNVITRPTYAGLTLLVAWIVFTVSIVLIPSWGTVTQTLGSDVLSFSQEISILLGLYGAITTNTTLFSAAVTLLLSIGVGINLAVFVYAIRRRTGGVGFGSGATSVGGLLGGIFGVGCAACGSLLVTAILPGVLGAAVTALPFGGQGIGLVGLILVGVSIYYVAREISTPPGTCAI